MRIDIPYYVYDDDPDWVDSWVYESLYRVTILKSMFITIRGQKDYIKANHDRPIFIYLQ